MQIVGDAGVNIQFPTTAAKGHDKPALKIEEVKTGMWITVNKNILADNKHWVSQMDKTTGRTGMVRAVDHQNGLILIQFYDPETAELNEWWYPIRVLEKPDKFVQPAFLDLQEDALQTKITESQNQLVSIFARKSVLSLLYHSGLTIVEGPLIVRDMLNLAGSLEISTPLFTMPTGSADQDAPYLKVLKQRLASLYESGSKSELTDLLVKETVKLLETNAKLDVDTVLNATSPKPIPNNAETFKIENARSVIVVFDRSGTSLPTNSQSSFVLSYDEAGTNVIRSYPEKSKFTPAIVSSNQFYLKLICTSQTHRNNCKYKFSVIPVHPNFALAFWLTDFLLENAPKHVSDLSGVYNAIFNSAVNYVYHAKTPTILKQSMFYLIGKLIQASRSVPEDKRPPLQRLVKLKDEMVGLYEAEKKRENFLFTSYLQSLIELMVVVKEAGGIEGLPAEDPMDIESETSLKGSQKTQEKKETKDLKTSGSAPVAQKTDDTLNLAIAIAQTIKDAEKSQISPRSETGDDDGFKAFSDAMNAEEKPEAEQSLFDDMDEEMKLALMLSMQSEAKPEAKTAPAQPPKPEEKPKNETFLPPPPVPPIAPSTGTGNLFSFGQLPPIVPSPRSSRTGRRSRSPSRSDLNSSATAVPTTPLSNSSASNPPANAPNTSTPATGNSLPWFMKVVETKRTLETLAAPDKFPVLMRELIKKAWNATKKETIKERIILVDNLPLLDVDKRDELEAVIRKSFTDVAQIDNEVFMPPDDNGKQTKGYAFLKVLSSQKVDTLVRKMHKHKLKAPHLFEEIVGPTQINLKSSLRSSAALPRGTVKVTRFQDLEKAEDPRSTEFLKWKLVQNNSLTPKCKAALVDVFNFFGGDKEGALTATQLNSLQMRSTGKNLTEEQVAFCFKHYKTKLVGEKKEPALALEGFLELYLRQCIEAPLDTWEELTKLGYDLDFNRSRYVVLEEALESFHNWTKIADYELMQYIENLYTEIEVSSPTHLVLDQIKPLENTQSGVQFRGEFITIIFVTLV